MRNPDDLFAALAKSPFRERFKLDAKDRRYLREHGLDTVLSHARTFLTDRLAPACPPNDGKQTPMRGHPAFVAQHATGTCCRSCLAKWHQIPKGRDLNDEELTYVLSILRRWLEARDVLEDPRLF